MAISIECPHCLKSLKVKEQFAGTVQKCPKCRGAMRIPELDLDESPAEAPQADFPSLPPIPDEELAVSELEETEVAWTTPQWDDAPQDPVPPPEVPFPEAPDPLAAQPTPPLGQGVGLTSFGTVLDFALDSSMITYVLQWMGLALLALLGAGVLGIIPVAGQFLAILAVPVIMFVTLQGICGGVSYLTAAKLRDGKAPGQERAWEIVQRRSMSLTLGFLGLLFLQAFVVWLIAAIVAGVSSIPYAGQVIGGILLIPVFVGVVLGFALAMSFFLMPAIITIEDCTAWEAHAILRRLVAEQTFYLLTNSLVALVSLIPACLLTFILTILPLAVAMALCGGGVFLEGTGYLTTPLIISASAIILTGFALGFVLVYVTVALIYCQCRGRAIVHS